MNGETLLVAHILRTDRGLDGFAPARAEGQPPQKIAAGLDLSLARFAMDGVEGKNDAAVFGIGNRQLQFLPITPNHVRPWKLAMSPYSVTRGIVTNLNGLA